MRIVVVGVGALGSHLVLLIRNLKVTIVAVDDDRVEHKNTMSQFHTTMSVGKHKTVALRDAMLGLFKVKIEIVPHRLIIDNVEQTLGKADLVVDCLDNAASRQIIQDFVRARSIPCLHGAVDQNGQFGRVAWDAHFAIDHEGTAGAATCEDGQHLPFIVRVSSHLADAVQAFVERGQRYGWQIHPGGSMRV